MLCEKKSCTGCSACYNICKKNAITISEDEYGNIYPQIDESKCINCGMCSKVCPVLNKVKKNKSINAYAMRLKDYKERSESTSGGAATALYKQVLKSKGIVYGVGNIKDNFSFVRINNVKDLYKVKGTKYVQSLVNDIYKTVKSDLDKEKEVLFVGTPCQVAGLKNYLLKDYSNLITVDIICHGVSNKKLLFEELENLKIDINDVKYISFRDEKMFNFKVVDNNDKVILEKNSEKVEYYRNFLRGNTYRENCYSCIYAEKDRISDITIGDFWGLDKESKVFDSKEKGISLIISNTKKGEALIKKIGEESLIEKRTLEEAYKVNAQLKRPSSKTKQYEIFKANYPKLGYKKTIKKMKTFKDRVSRLIDNNKLLKKTYEKIRRN